MRTASFIASRPMPISSPSSSPSALAKPVFSMVTVTWRSFSSSMVLAEAALQQFDQRGQGWPWVMALAASAMRKRGLAGDRRLAGFFHHDLRRSIWGWGVVFFQLPCRDGASLGEDWPTV
jgi:hypothetical protein